MITDGPISVTNESFMEHIDSRTRQKTENSLAKYILVGELPPLMGGHHLTG